jgi:hypothetical protein
MSVGVYFIFEGQLNQPQTVTVGQAVSEKKMYLTIITMFYCQLKKKRSLALSV